MLSKKKVPLSIRENSDFVKKYGFNCVIWERKQLKKTNKKSLVRFPKRAFSFMLGFLLNVSGGAG